MKLKGSRVLARIAAREVLRARGRSALIVAMIALPVALVVTGSILHRTTTPTLQEQISRELGTADLRIDHDTGDTAWLEALPAESRVVTHSESSVEVAVGGQFRLVSVSDMPLDDPLTSGRLVLVGGSAPRTADEAAVSPSLLDAAGIEVGETLRIEGFPELRVSGEVVQPHSIHWDLIVVGKGGFEPGPRSTSFVDVPAGAEARIEAVRKDVGGDTRWTTTADSLDSLIPPDAGPLGVIVISLLGGLALLETAMVAGAAFAVGVRRQLRSYGLLGAVGADERHIRRIVLMSGIGLGGVGALAGVAAGLGVAFVASPWIDLLNGQYNGPLTIVLLDYLGIMILGVVAATASAFIPARSAGRVSVLEALAGRRSVPARTGVRWARAGLLSVAGGAMMLVAGAFVELGSKSFFVLVGTIAIVAGLAACSPLLIAWVAKHAHRTPAPLRIALRESGRNAHRGGPAVAAIMSALALAVTLSTFIATADAGPKYQPEGLQFRHAILAISALTALGVVAAAVGLSAAESKAEWIKMSAIGMAPKMRRTLAASQAFVLAGLGAALAIPGGMIPALAALIAYEEYLIVLPWDALLVVAFGVPAVAAVGAWLLTRPGRRVEARFW